QLPFLSLIIPIWMVKCMCSWRQTWEIWPVLLVAGGSFALFQFTFATIHAYVPGLLIYPMTDIGGGIFSFVVTAIFLNFWKPPSACRFDAPHPVTATPTAVPGDPHAARAAALVGAGNPHPTTADTPLTGARIALAWAPFALMSLFLLLTGLIRQREKP